MNSIAAADEFRAERDLNPPTSVTGVKVVTDFPDDVLADHVGVRNAPDVSSAGDIRVVGSAAVESVAVVKNGVAAANDSAVGGPAQVDKKSNNSMLKLKKKWKEIKKKNKKNFSKALENLTNNSKKETKSKEKDFSESIEMSGTEQTLTRQNSLMSLTMVSKKLNFALVQRLERSALEP